MQLADAVERWGVSNRSVLDPSETEFLRRTWSTLRASPAGSLDVGELTNSESAEVVALFDESDRDAVVTTLNSVTSWIQTQPQEIEVRRQRPPALPGTEKRGVLSDEATRRRRRLGLQLAASSGVMLAVLIVVTLLL